MTGPQVKALRIALGLSYTQAGLLFGVSRSTIQAWETRGPPYPARILLELIKNDPTLVRRIGRVDRCGLA